MNYKTTSSNTRAGRLLERPISLLNNIQSPPAIPNTILAGQNLRNTTGTSNVTLQEWIKTYKKAFPMFVFYFHNIHDTSLIHNLENRVRLLGSVNFNCLYYFREWSHFFLILLRI